MIYNHQDLWYIHFLIIYSFRSSVTFEIKTFRRFALGRGAGALCTLLSFVFFSLVYYKLFRPDLSISHLAWTASSYFWFARVTPVPDCSERLEIFYPRSRTSLSLVRLLWVLEFWCLFRESTPKISSTLRQEFIITYKLISEMSEFFRTVTNFENKCIMI